MVSTFAVGVGTVNRAGNSAASPLATAFNDAAVFTDWSGFRIRSASFTAYS